MRLFWLLFLIPGHLIGQTKDDSKEFVRSIFSIDAGLMGPQLGFELRAGADRTVLLRAGLAPVYYSRSVDFGTGTAAQLSMSINLSTEYRIYYNFKKRELEEKTIKNNSGNYFALAFGFLSEPLTRKYYFEDGGHLYIGPLWGLNRAVAKGINFNVNLGPGYMFGVSNSAHGFTILGDFRVLFILKK